ncbi:hypothetical protein, partial [Paenibacillus sp. J53TS2]|uniref:hypothetical protein n=1 Tax=Paenibacillus sp. J53TS2 TaxID=2807197 RepID=UPI001BD0DCD8
SISCTMANFSTSVSFLFGMKNAPPHGKQVLLFHLSTVGGAYQGLVGFLFLPRRTKLTVYPCRLIYTHQIR